MNGMETSPDDPQAEYTHHLSVPTQRIREKKSP